MAFSQAPTLSGADLEERAERRRETHLGRGSWLDRGSIRPRKSLVGRQETETGFRLRIKRMQMQRSRGQRGWGWGAARPMGEEDRLG